MMWKCWSKSLGPLFMKAKTSLLVGVWLLLFCSSASAENFIYEDAYSGSVITIDTVNSTLSFLDITSRAEICSGQSDFICFESKQLVFAIPKLIDGNSAEWEYKGHVFKSEGLYEFSILGQRVSAYSINSKVDALGLKFLYSPNQGLIGFYLYDLQSRFGRAYYAVDSKGFGQP